MIHCSIAFLAFRAEAQDPFRHVWVDGLLRAPAPCSLPGAGFAGVKGFLMSAPARRRLMELEFASEH